MAQEPIFVKGFTVVLPKTPYADNPFADIKALGADWVCITPFRSMDLSKPFISRSFEEEWWGLRKEGIEKSITLAREQGLKIMLKPQIYVKKSWPGDVDFETDSDWLAFQKDYDDFINFCIDIAISYELEIFCIGTELKYAVTKRPTYWSNLIERIKQVYAGLVTYSANWDNYKHIKFWRALDFISISSYKPISATPNPPVPLLIYNYQNYFRELKRFAKKNKRKILFSEYGFLSVEAAAYKHWELEKEFDMLLASETAQANAFEALYEVFWKEDFWLGGFIWKWYPRGFSHQVPIEKDYTVQGKSALNVITKRFKSNK